VTFSPLSSAYAWILETRARRHGAPHRLAQPVISVGNVTVGGTGKTPLVECLARHYRSQGMRPAILSRGYGRSSLGPVLVSAGQGPLVGPGEGGDEPVELARRLPGVIVAVSRNRVDAAREAARLGADLFLLDDGFQHLRLARDIDLVLVDARDPFGGETFPPRGRLREPLSALARADAFVFTHVAEKPPSPALATLARINPAAPVFCARFPALGIWDENGSRLDLERVARQPFIAVCGVAAPATFSASLAELGLSAQETLVFRDHQRYRKRHLVSIRGAVVRTAACRVITTEKDAVKLAGRLPLPLATLRRRVEIADPGFLEMLDSRLSLAFRDEARPARR
jgi:tetraacyldisaccharide 4'-kinase